MKPLNYITLADKKPYKLLFFLLLMSPCISWAQSSPPPYYGEIEYQYDARGNRVLRKIFVYPPSIRQIPDSTKINRDQDNEDPMGRNEQVKEEAMQKAIDMGLSVYPNPTQAAVYVAINSLQQGNKAELTVFDNLGRLVVRKEQTTNVDTIDLGILNTGIYFIKVAMGGETLVYKIIKE